MCIFSLLWLNWRCLLLVLVQIIEFVSRISSSAWWWPLLVIDELNARRDIDEQHSETIRLLRPHRFAKSVIMGISRWAEILCLQWHLNLFLQLKKFLDELSNKDRFGIAVEPQNRMSVAIDEEFLEIPSDIVGMFRRVENHRLIFEVFLRRRHARFQIFVQGMLTLPIHIDQPKQGKVRLEILARSNVFQTVQQFRLGLCRLLIAELIAGNAENGEMLRRGEFFLQCIQLLVLKRHSSERGHIDDQTQLISILR